jgi:hypothetical protein
MAAPEASPRLSRAIRLRSAMTPTAAIFARTSVLLRGLARKSKAPASKPFILSSWAASALMNMAGTSLLRESSARSHSSSSNPSISGILTSRMKMSKSLADASDKASFPFIAQTSS